MTKREQIAFYKRLKKAAENNKIVALQNYEIATQIEREATTALEKLVVSKGQARKGDDILTPKQKMEYLARVVPLIDI